MPAYLTHYTCGLLGYHGLSQGDLKRIIRDHACVYNMGLAGPDLFFYSVWEIMTRRVPIGRIIHKYRTGRFLQAMFDKVKGLQRSSDPGNSSAAEKDTAYETALAYFAGFVGHYCLDSRAHALVYRKCAHQNSSVALGKHFRYEAAMDAMCCERLLNRNIKCSHQMQLLRLTPADRQVISDLLFHALQETYGREVKIPSKRRLRLILKEYFLISGLITDPTGFKEYLFQKLEKKKPGYPYASPLFINDNRYGLGEDDWQRFYIRFRRGERALERAFSKLSEAVEERYGTGREDAFWNEIGSWSYHGAGLPEAASDLPLSELIGPPF